MKKEGKVDLLSILVFSIFILLVYAVFVFGNAGVFAEFPVNFTNASATAGFAAGSLPSMAAFSGNSPLFRCNVSTPANNSQTYSNITNVSLFIRDSLITDIDLAIPNQTFKINDSTRSQVINLTFPLTLGEGTYYWACRSEDNQTPITYNSTTNRTFIVDKTPPAFGTNVINTSNSVISTGNRIYVAVNASDGLTTIKGARLFVNFSGTVDNEVANASGIATGNNTLMNLSFLIPGSALGIKALNVTFQVNDSVSNFNVTSALIFSIDGDGTPPGIILNKPAGGFNQTSTTAPDFNFTAYDNNETTTITCSINITVGTGYMPIANISNIAAVNGTPQINSTSFSFSNGTYNWNVSCIDGASNINTSLSRTFIIDQIPPVVVYFNITNQSAFSPLGDSSIHQLGLGDDFSVVQTLARNITTSDNLSDTLFITANWSDNLTTPFQVDLQFYNVSKSAGNEWQTINTTKINLSNGTWGNMSFTIPAGHNNFEGANISFRVIANDTLGNINTSASVKNFTIQINDTTKPTLTVSSVAGQAHVNGTNTSDTTPTIVWNVTEGSNLKYIAIQVDSLADDLCGFKNHSTILAANNNRNGSLDLFTAALCPSLGNGTHTVRLTAQDAWGNSELYIHSFNIQTGKPTITFSSVQNHTSGVFPTGLLAGNLTNNTNLSVTPRYGLSFSAVDGATGVMKDLSWTSSCNSTTQTLSSSVSNFTAINNTNIFPFHENISDSCDNREANQTVSITAADSVGNSVTNVFKFAVDDLGPTIVVHSPVSGQRFTNFVEVNVSAYDSMSRVEAIGYYLDNNSLVFNHTINGTITAAQGLNSSIRSIEINVTPGAHTIKVTVNDTLGNVRNSSFITFTKTGPLSPANEISNSTSAYLSAINYVPFNATLRLKSGDGSYTTLSTNVTESDQTFEILLVTNSTSANNQINVSLTEINGSGANWDKINFSVFINETTVQTNIQNNWSNTVEHLVHFNSSIDEFLSNANDYYGTVLVPVNVSGGLEIWWFSDEADLSSRTNVSACTSAFTATTTTPCFNFTSGGKTLVNVPHFSDVVVVNDTTAPTIIVNTPEPTTGNQTVSMFRPNITVTSDTASCIYQINGSTPIPMTLSGTICLGQTERFKNSNVDDGYNVTFNATDATGNVGSLKFLLNVSDGAAPSSPNSSRVSVSGQTSTAATIDITSMNESVNVTIVYGTTPGSLSSIAHETDFNSTQAVSLSSLSASTTYHFNVSVCDFNGNCAKNLTFNFSTSAAAAAAAAASSSSGGGGGGGAAAVSNVQGEKAQVWSSIPSGASVSLKVDSADIGVTTVSVSVNTAVSNVEIKVSGLKDKPVEKEAAAKVYQYLQLTKKNLLDTQADKITVGFRVTKSWLTDNSLQSADVSLFRYKDNEWAQLSTKVISSDDTYVNYEALTPGFSYFAIGSGAAGAAPGEAPAEEAPKAPTPEEGAPTPVEAPKPIEAPKKAPVGWIVLAVVVVIGIIGYVVYQQKKK